MIFYKIVYSVPPIPLNATPEQKKKDIGPIAFRLVFKNGEKIKEIPGCTVISRNLGNKRSV